MTFRTVIPGLALATLATAGLAGSAQAEDEFPLVYGQRPIVLTKGLSQVDAAFSALKLDNPFIDDVFLRLDASYNYGVLDDLTAGILAVPLALSPEADYGNPQVYGTYRFLNGPVEVGAHLRLTLPVNGGDFGAGVGALARFDLNKAAYINVGLLLNMTFGDSTVLGLNVPVEFAVSFTRQLFFTVDTGLFFPNFDGDAWSVPLGVGLGYTLEAPNGGPLADIFFKFSLPTAINNSAVFETFDWQAQLGGHFFF